MAIDSIIHDGNSGRIYNVGGSCEKSNIEIVETILSELGKSYDLIEYVKDRPGHDLRYAIDSTRIEKELGWKAEVDLQEGIRDTIKWYVEHNS
jgi:dTDP-glucose 4,6-dehydratase